MELGVTVHPGTLIGEIGIFAPSGQRMDTAICESDVELASISNDKVWQLYHQNPKFGFYLIKLVIDRLLQNSSKQQSAAVARNRALRRFDRRREAARGLPDCDAETRRARTRER
jgi:CRP/FNR family cyclic AMP-dependent transcriptional regulator